jgi:hypothetical protein
MNEAPDFENHGPHRRLLIRAGKFALQGVILALVTWGMWGTIVQARQQLLEKQLSAWDIEAWSPAVCSGTA